MFSLRFKVFLCKFQLRFFDPTKFSLVGMTVAGFGESTPPARREFNDFYQRDAEDGVELMKILGFNKCS